MEKSFTKTGKTVYLFLVLVGLIVGIDGAIAHGLIRVIFGIGFEVAAGVYFCIISIKPVGWHGHTFSKK